jgi:hypothetical protein
MNHAARQAALDHHPPAVMPAGTLRLPEDPLMLEFPDRHQIASPGLAMLSRTGLAHLMRPGSGGFAVVGICGRESIFASARDFA